VDRKPDVPRLEVAARFVELTASQGARAEALTMQRLAETSMITLDDVQNAHGRLQGVILHTPLLPFSGTQAGGRLFFKPENFQPIGAFKLRGAYNKVASLSDAERARGIIAFSSGNHAQGVAYAARALGVKAVIIMPAAAPEIKRARTEALGAEVVLTEHGGEPQWRALAEQMAAEHGYAIVHPFNDELVIAGQGTVGLEIVQDLPEVETVLVPIGGGGLISGVAAAVKRQRPKARVIGVEPEIAADAQASLRAGRIEEWPGEQTRKTIADGMRTPRLGDLTFAHISAFVDDIVTVSEAEIRRAVRRMALEARIVAEPSGAVTFAAWLFRQDELPAAQNTVAVISGGNIDPRLLAEIVAETD
jgi:threonine dehydratase